MAATSQTAFQSATVAMRANVSNAADRLGIHFTPANPQCKMMYGECFFLPEFRFFRRRCPDESESLVVASTYAAIVYYIRDVLRCEPLEDRHLLSVGVPTARSVGRFGTAHGGSPGPCPGRSPPVSQRTRRKFRGRPIPTLVAGVDQIFAGSNMLPGPVEPSSDMDQCGRRR